MSQYVSREAVKAAIEDDFWTKLADETVELFRKALASLPSASPPGSERPPMLRAFVTQLGDDAKPEWWLRVDVTETWLAVQQPNGVLNLGSSWLTVDREASDKAALALYDSDLTTRGAGR